MGNIYKQTLSKLALVKIDENYIKVLKKVEI